MAAPKPKPKPKDKPFHWPKADVKAVAKMAKEDAAERRRSEQNKARIASKGAGGGNTRNLRT